MVYAQNPVVEHMSKISNLPDVEFYDILEDDDHYIWLAADKGLYRYNGKNYKKFTNPNQKVNSLFQLKLDENGRLWCINLYGQLFYVENNTLTLFYDANKLVKEILNLPINFFFGRTMGGGIVFSRLPYVGMMKPDLRSESSKSFRVS